MRNSNKAKPVLPIAAIQWLRWPDWRILHLQHGHAPSIFSLSEKRIKPVNRWFLITWFWWCAKSRRRAESKRQRRGKVCASCVRLDAVTGQKCKQKITSCPPSSFHAAASEWRHVPDDDPLLLLWLLRRFLLIRLNHEPTLHPFYYIFTSLKGLHNYYGVPYRPPLDA